MSGRILVFARKLTSITRERRDKVLVKIALKGSW
jgi:hypothetical protein